ncbi:hypothetical protein L1987_71550 [Smallanthus sonchifolius]|uniref:Uncharacterized protein n=1 Tax=Smallanthus sonchifolius TaxID=185202 RepID=A0ACB9ATL8_9ASTR|nr:hypothetical protein L1987_71550 [Smallanthus sonchifolius]
MATYLIHVQPNPIVRASASTSSTASSQKSDPQRKSWWTPLFGLSSKPDYIDSKNSDKITANNTTSSARTGARSESDLGQKPVISRVSPANFTNEKVRKLRMLMMEMELFHDAMNHSAMASRLASDFYDRLDR